MIARKFIGRVRAYVGFDLAVPRHLATQDLATPSLALAWVDPDAVTGGILLGTRWLFDAAGLS